ncbi:MAG TPA: AAA family ATPase, partial [Prolixibacteraceae bacterium]|nr:AAA family ATPase [Prolixibacteraceae bacterium]
MKENIANIVKYNFWDGNSPETGFQRSAYLERILKFSGSKLIRVLVGQRRAGKSFILRQIIKNLVESGIHGSHTLYINKEFVEYDFITNYKQLAEFVQLYRTEMKLGGKLYLFLDEVQHIEGWERTVDSFAQDFAEQYELYITGSNSELL